MCCPLLVTYLHPARHHPHCLIPWNPTEILAVTCVVFLHLLTIPGTFLGAAKWIQASFTVCVDSSFMMGPIRIRQDLLPAQIPLGTFEARVVKSFLCQQFPGSYALINKTSDGLTNKSGIMALTENNTSAPARKSINYNRFSRRNKKHSPFVDNRIN